MTITDGARYGRNKTGSIGGPFRSKLADYKVHSGVQFFTWVGFFSERDVASFTGDVAVAIMIAVGGGVAITIWRFIQKGLGAPGSAR